MITYIISLLGFFGIALGIDISIRDFKKNRFNSILGTTSAGLGIFLELGMLIKIAIALS